MISKIQTFLSPFTVITFITALVGCVRRHKIVFMDLQFFIVSYDVVMLMNAK